MTKQSVTFLFMAVLGGILVLSYLISSFFKIELLCIILSILNSAVATATLVYSYLKSQNKKTAGRALLFFALSCFFWFVGDVLFLTVALLGGNPEKSAVVICAYTLTNVFSGIAALSYSYYQFKKLGSAQLMLDTLVITITSLMLAWITFFSKDGAWIKLFLQDGLCSAASITIDFLEIIGVLIVLYYTRSIKLPPYLLLFSSGIFSYAFADLYYYYIYAHDQYIPNSIVDVIYVTALVLISLGGLSKTLFDSGNSAEIGVELGTGRKWIVLFLIPAVAILFEGFVFMDVLNFFAAIIIYKVLSNQVQITAEKGELYRKELEINSTLEKRLEEQYGRLIYLANHDTVTNLNNRRFFLNSLDDAIKEYTSGESLAVFMIDIDRFKTINDTFGHDVGDKVLIEVSARMQECTSGWAVPARLGGDEFALFIRGNYSRDMIAGFADDIIKICTLPVTVEDSRLQITMSLGIALYGAGGDSRITLMKNADIAMYRAKSLGYNKYVFYDPSLIRGISRKSEIEILLRKANIEKDFELFYQPQFDIMEDKLIGAEALLRWKIAEYGYIPPNDFIPVAEEINYMFRIGRWVMNHAVVQIIEWNTTYCIDLKMGINISPKQIEDEDFIRTIKDLASYDNFKSAWIDAEVTENLILDDYRKTSSVFEALKEHHITVSVDDFGSGYSSFDYLNKFSFDRIKIDKSLIGQLSESNANSIEIVKAVIAMAEAIGIGVVAEGVETQEQLMILKSLNCRQAQGYYLGRPVPASEFEEAFIKNRKGTV